MDSYLQPLPFLTPFTSIGRRSGGVSLLFLNINLVYDRVSDVVENGVSFASKILTHNRMH